MGGVNILPVYTTCLGILPTFLRFIYSCYSNFTNLFNRERLILSMTAPRPALVPRDVLDLHGNQPHSIDEIQQGKVWRVGYERENHFLARWDTRQQLKLLGLDLSREETQWRIMQVVCECARQRINLVNFRELNPGAEQLVIRLTGTCRLLRKTGRRGKRETWRW